MAPKYTARHMMPAAELNRETLDPWLNRRLINPENRSPGIGYPQVYTYVDILRVAVMADMVRLGFKPSVASWLSEIPQYDMMQPDSFLAVWHGSTEYTGQHTVLDEPLAQHLSFLMIRAGDLLEQLAVLPAVTVVNIPLIRTRVDKVLKEMDAL